MKGLSVFAVILLVTIISYQCCDAYRVYLDNNEDLTSNQLKTNLFKNLRGKKSASGREAREFGSTDMELGSGGSSALKTKALMRCYFSPVSCFRRRK